VITDKLLITVCDVTLQDSTERAPNKPSPHTKERKRHSTKTKTRNIKTVDLVLRVTACKIQVAC